MNNKLWDVASIASSRDMELVAQFLEKNFKISKGEPTWTKESLQWKITNMNPAGTGVMVCAKYEEKIIGTASLVKKRAMLDGQECIVAEIGDTYTDSNFRRSGRARVEVSDSRGDYLNKSIFGRLVSEVLRQAELSNVQIVYGTPNKNSYPGYISKLGFTNANFEKSNELYFCYRITLQGMLKYFGIELKISSKSKNRSAYIKKNNICYSIKRKAATETEINLMYERSANKKGFEFILDYSYWDHRYLRHPFAKYNVISVYQDEIFKGIFAYRIFTNENNKNICYIMDYLFEKKQINISDIIKIIKLQEDEKIDFYAYSEISKKKKFAILRLEYRRKVELIEYCIAKLPTQFNKFSYGNCDAA